MTRCAFCRFDMGNSAGLRRRLRISKSGRVYCSMNCRSNWMADNKTKTDKG